MCDCAIKNVEKIMEMYPDAISVTDQHEILSGRAYSVIKVQQPGKRKAKELLLLHSYCPTCGAKYPPTEQ